MSLSLPTRPPALRVPTPEPRGLWSDEGLPEVESLMLRLCTGERLDRLGTLLWDHVSSGGKRLRARLALSTADALGASRAAAVGWAAACELLHNASLLHDDVQDGDRRRRGRETMWVRHGAAQAINAGDLGLMLPTLALEHVPGDDALRWRLARTLSWRAQQVVRGQALELDMQARDLLDWDSYLAAAEGKTAALFSLPVEGTALLSGLEPSRARALGESFGAIGLLFQLQDDVLDLFGDKGRGEVGSDLREGKISALVVEHLRLHPHDTPWLVELLRLPRDRTPEAWVHEAIRRFRDGGALAGVWRRIAALDDLVAEDPELMPWPRLHALAMELVSRALSPIIHTNPNHTLREWA